MLLLFFLLLWRPQMARLDELDKKIVQEEERYKVAKSTLERLKEVKKKAAAAEVELVKITKQMPPEPKLPEFIEEVQDMANDAGVEFIMIRPGKPEKPEKPGETNQVSEYNEMQIEASARGSYVAIIDFLRRIEKAPRALKVTKIEVKLSDKKPYPDLDLNMTVSAFTMEGSKQAVSPSQVKSASIKN